MRRFSLRDAGVQIGEVISAWMSARLVKWSLPAEMIVKATLLGMKVSEIPTKQLPDGRDRPPHLRTWLDGWRHLRFLLMYSPRWLFLYPGTTLILLGSAGCAWLLPQTRVIDGFAFDVRTLVFAFAAVLLGFSDHCVRGIYQGICRISEGYVLPDDPRLTRAFRYITLEIGLAIGAVTCGTRNWGNGTDLL